MRVRPRSALNLLAAGIVSAAILYASFFGAGPLPALGPAFNPTTGAWTMALDASINSETLHLAGLRRPVTITLEKDGTAHVVANTDHDVFLAVGYLHARFRLFQMDLLRRQDRKSTRLNSSHPSISYAVFCLKKKKTTNKKVYQKKKNTKKKKKNKTTEKTPN